MNFFKKIFKTKILLFSFLYSTFGLIASVTAAQPLMNKPYTDPTPEAVKKDIKFELYNKIKFDIWVWLAFITSDNNDGIPVTKFEIKSGNVFQIKEEVFQKYYRKCSTCGTGDVPVLDLRLYITTAGSGIKFGNPCKSERGNPGTFAYVSPGNSYVDIFDDVVIRNIKKDEKIYIEYTHGPGPDGILVIKPRTGKLDWRRNPTGFTHSGLPLNNNIKQENIKVLRTSDWRWAGVVENEKRATFCLDFVKSGPSVRAEPTKPQPQPKPQEKPQPQAPQPGLKLVKITKPVADSLGIQLTPGELTALQQDKDKSVGINPLRVLGFDPNNPPKAAEEHTKFRQLSIKWHPDKTPIGASQSLYTEVYKSLNDAHGSLENKLK